MKSLLLSLTLLGSTYMLAQTYTPVTVTGFNMDAVAENTVASTTTSGPIDGSNYAMYSAAYGALYNISKGLPNSGTVVSGTRTYQLNPYTGNNNCYILSGQKDSLILTTPASFAALSLLGCATEGNCAMTLTVRFTDGTNQVFSGLTMSDWYNGSNAILSGIDRVDRTTGNPGNVSGNPRLYATDIVLACANRSKMVSKLVIQNGGTNPRICAFALSAAALPTYTANVTNACFGISNGKATIVPTGGVPAYTYTWTTSPVQNTVTATGLPPGTYTVTINDGPGCTNTISATVSQPTAALTTTIAATSATLCAGKSTTLTTSGATTYTWSTTSSGASIVVTPASSATYSVSGTTAAGCPITGSINLTVNALPVISFSLAQPVLCSNSSIVALNATPVGGVYAGAGITGTNYAPSVAGVGTNTISYSYTNTNGCTSTSVISSTVNAAPVVTFSLTQTQFCINSAIIFLSGTPASGVFSGTGGVTGTIFTPSAAGVGTHTVTYTYTNASNCTASASSIATVSACTGIEELGTTGITVYPNPGKGFFKIHATTDMQLTVTNQTGQILSTLTVKAGDNEMNLNGFSAGVYFLSGQNGQQLMKQKIVIID
jgi:hypothetical protein